MIMIVKDYNDRPKGLRYFGSFRYPGHYCAVYAIKDGEDSTPINPEAKDMAESFNRGEYAISIEGKIYYGCQSIF